MKIKYMPIAIEKKFIQQDSLAKVAKADLDDTKKEIHRHLARGEQAQLLIVKQAEEGVSSIDWKAEALLLAEKVYGTPAKAARWRTGLDKKYPKQMRAAAISSPKESKIVSIEKGRKHAA